MLMQLAQIKKAIDAAEQIIGGNVGVEVEAVEQWGLCNFLTSHHVDALNLSRQHSTTRRTSRSAKGRVFQQNRPKAEIGM